MWKNDIFYENGYKFCTPNFTIGKIVPNLKFSSAFSSFFNQENV